MRCGPTAMTSWCAASMRCPLLHGPRLSETVALHAGNLKDIVLRFVPGWMPRTDDRVAIPLAGGRVVLHGTFDLLVGLPQPGTRSPCALGLSTSGPWAWRWRSLHFLALLETLRSGAPPSASRCRSSRPPAVTASRTCARSTSG